MRQTKFSAAGGHYDPPQRRRLVPFFALLLGNVVIGISPVFVRYADVGPISSGFWRLALAVPILFLLGRLSGFRLPAVPAKIIYWAAIAGVIFGLDIICWHLGIFRTKLGNATLFGNSASLFLVLYGVVLARKLPPPMQIAALILAFAGAALLMGQSLELSARSFTGDLLSLFAGIFYTFYLLIMIRLRATTESWGALAMTSFFAALALLIGALIAGETIWPTIWWPLIALALASQILGTGLFTYALPFFSHLIIGLTLLLQPALAALTGWLFFGETLTGLDIIGGMLVMAALILVHLSDKQR